MRVRPETLLLAVLSLFALSGMYAALVYQPYDVRPVDPFVGTIDRAPNIVEPVRADPHDAAAWFGSIRRFCNPVEVETQLRWQPAPETHQGAMHEAACLALAGKTDLARRVIETLPPDVRHQAAGVVFDAGHPAADAGDELAAGPLMELVVEYWPNHYMALYHAGAARYQRGDHESAAAYLTRFLEEYHVEDGWHESAVSMLDSMDR